ncbi:hypothetical protein DAY02_01145 [Salmonella enterica subsp. enterica]|nr:hypothetical protein DAY02_01145 [Salmonella enterica subsp. enterica]PUF48163.1 hypothetical protein DAX96_02565 [Salmonella enterica subsp. enterica]PUF48177.1 hypothetical protein DAX96_02635 [Salmonella enterica subsp. enterica]PUO44580.1 hypothetical protein DAX56_26450 [Salmonella enterica subsp. enterica]PUP66255.1 hypothetical protein DAX83_05330 [Salmonella enterica subsp. enterica]
MQQADISRISSGTPKENAGCGKLRGSVNRLISCKPAYQNAANDFRYNSAGNNGRNGRNK